MLTKLTGVKKFVALKLKKTTMKMRPRTIGRTPRFPDLMLSTTRRIAPAQPARLRLVGRAAAWSWPTTSTSGGAHGVASCAVAGSPETFVGMPAVIASTTSCWVVFARS